jgi:autotransporter-associated beta strand protein
LATILATTSNSGTINYTTLNSTYSSGTLSWSSGITTRSVNSLTIDTTNTGGTIDMGASSNILTLSGAAILFRGANNAILQGGQVNANFVVHQTGAGTLTINSLISGATKLVKDGTGTLVLGANNTYTGTTIINAGILKLGAAGDATNTPLGTTGAGTTVNTGAALDLGGFSLGTAEALSLNGTGISSGGALLNSGSAASYSGLLTLGSNASIVANNNITLSATGTITGSGFGLTLDGSATGSSLASIIGTGAGTLTKSGTGTWILSGANTYSGTTTISEGTLVGVVGGSCSNSAVTVASARALGISITDITKKWTCASLALNNGSQLKFNFTVPTPHASEAPLNILGNLTFSETSTIVVSPRTTTPGKYPLLTVGGTVLTTSLPTLSPDGVNGRLVWEGKTLWVTIVQAGTMIRFL